MPTKKKPAPRAVAKNLHVELLSYINVKISVYKELYALAESRKSTIEEVLIFFLRDHTPPKIIELSMDSMMPFGKYEGLSVASVVRNNPDYIIWMMQNVKRVQFDHNVCKVMADSYDY